MRVLHVQKAAGIGGSERHLLTLLPALARRGVDVRMCVLAAGDAPRFLSELSSLDVETTTLGAGPHANAALVQRLRREIRVFRPDLVHTHLIHADLYGQLAARTMKVPGISTVHGTPSFYRHQPYRTVGRLAGRLVRCSIAISHHVAGFLREHHLAVSDRLRVIHYGIDAGEWILPDGDHARVRGALGIGSDEVVVGIAARLIPGKGHDVLLDAMRLASTEVANLRLLVAGDGPLATELRATVRDWPEATSIRFLGFVADVRGFMNACDMIVFPTSPALSEGFGLSALEAMAAHRPVIATAVGALPEVVVDGETGVLVAPGSAAELAQAIVALANDRRLSKRLGAAGGCRASTLFNVGRMVDQTLAVYDACA